MVYLFQFNFELLPIPIHSPSFSAITTKQSVCYETKIKDYKD